MTATAPDTIFAYDFLNAVDSLVGCSVSSVVDSGLYFRLLNFLNLQRYKKSFIFASLVLIVFLI